MRPAADVSGLSADSSLTLPEAAAYLRSMQCHALYTAHFNSNGEYPLECDAVALPLPFPARTVNALRGLLDAAREQDEQLGSNASDVRSARKASAANATRALSQRRALAELSTTGSLSAADDASADDYEAVSGSRDGCVQGYAACSAEDVSFVATSELRSDSDLVQDALCYAAIAQSVADAEVDLFWQDTASAVRVMASVRALDTSASVPMCTGQTGSRTVFAKKVGSCIDGGESRSPEGVRFTGRCCFMLDVCGWCAVHARQCGERVWHDELVKGARVGPP